MTRQLRGMVALTATAQILLALLLLQRGFPYYGSARVSQGRVWEVPVAVLHLPGIGLLSAAGLCCGMRNGLVLPARMVAGHVPMRPAGVLLLALANWAVWVALLLLGRWAWQRRRVRTASITGPPERS